MHSTEQANNFETIAEEDEEGSSSDSGEGESRLDRLKATARANVLRRLTHGKDNNKDKEDDTASETSLKLERSLSQKQLLVEKAAMGKDLAQK